MIAYLVIAALAVQSAPQQFDVACAGQEWDRASGGRASDFEVRLRIDLTAMRWCRGDCRTAREIKSVSADRIILEDETPAQGSRVRVTASAYLDRTAGTFHELFSMRSGTVQGYRRQAQCVVAPFSGMPQAHF